MSKDYKLILQPGLTVKQLYQEAIIQDFQSLIYIIEWLVYEKKLLTMERDARNVEYVVRKYGNELWSSVK